MKYIRMAIEAESPEQFGYDKIKYNLTESSVADRSLSDLNLKIDDILLCYGDHIGNTDLRTLLASEHPSISKEDVLITAGASSALFYIATSLLEKDDHLIVVKPNYATNIETPRAIGCEISFVDATYENGFQFSVEEIEKLIRPNTKYVSITVPHNPTGVGISEDTLRRLIAVVEKHGIYLLSDETYREMTLGTMLPIAATLSENVISVSSLSKTYGIPGIRLGWLICRNKELMHLFLCAKEQVGICGSVVDEEIGYHALKQKESWLAYNNNRIREAFDVVKEWIDNEPNLEWVEPTGGCVCFPRIKESVAIDIEKFYQVLNEKYGTYVGPGHWFEESKRSFRIGYAWPTLEELKAGLKGISMAIADTKN